MRESVKGGRPRVRDIAVTGAMSRPGSHAVGTVPPSITYSVPEIAAARGETKGDQVGDFFWLRRTTKRYAAQSLHDDFFSALIVCARLLRQSLRKGHGRLRFHPARRNPYHPYAPWRHLLRQALAIRRKGGLSRPPPAPASRATAPGRAERPA